MTTLVHTCPEGPSGKQTELLTPSDRIRSRILTLDSSLVDNVSDVPGATVTEALDALLSGSVAATPLAQVIGWAPPPAGNSQPLVLLPTDHLPGLYEIAWCAVIRVAALTGATMQGVLTHDSIVGAESRQLFNTGSWVNVGTSLQNGGTQAGTLRQATIFSAGTAPITITFSSGAVTGDPLANLYGAARLIAASAP